MDRTTFDTYVRLVAVLAGAFVGFALIAPALFAVVDRAGAIVIALGTALVVAVVPPLVNYLFTGSLDAAQLGTALTAVVSGLGVLVAKTVIDHRATTQ